jgi:MFS family permease
MGLAPSLGPIVGGLVTSYLGWRWSFLINLPLGIGLICLAVTSTDESRDPHAGRLDLPGISLFGAGLFCIVWALIDANNVGWGSASTFLKLVAGAVLLVGFVFAERTHPRPMIDLALFRDPTAIGAGVSMLGYAASAQVMMTILPLYLQDAFDFAPATAGIAMIPFALPLLFGPMAGAKLSARLSSRALLTFGLATVALGNAIVVAGIVAGAGYWAAATGMVITGFTTGLLNAETTKAQVAAIPPERAGMAGGLAATTRFIGIIAGVAALGAVLAAVAEATLRRLGTPRVPGEAVEWHTLSLRIVGGDANGALLELPEGVRNALIEAVRDSVAAGFGAVLAVAVIVALLSSTLCWYLIRFPEPSK